jgi:MtfA peptidase
MAQPLFISLGFILLSLLVWCLGRWLRYQARQKRWEAARGFHWSEARKALLARCFPLYLNLNPREQQRLTELVAYFLLHKRISALGGLELSEEMQFLIAAPACLLLLHLDTTEVYPDLVNIFVVPDSYVEAENPVNPATGLPLHRERLGEAWKRGPLVLSWKTLQTEGRMRTRKHDLVLHEFSHHLDQQDGHFDGTPEMPDQQQYLRWAKVMGKEFHSLRKQLRQSKGSDIDAYAASNEAEFFAVCTEYFFTSPHEMARLHGELFEIYRNYFKVDTRRWFR